jgi:hypothetical protein
MLHLIPADLPVPRAAVVSWNLVSQEQEDVEHLVGQGVIDMAAAFGEKRRGKGTRGPCSTEDRVSLRQCP